LDSSKSTDVERKNQFVSNGTKYKVKSFEQFSRVIWLERSVACKNLLGKKCEVKYCSQSMLGLWYLISVD